MTYIMEKQKLKDGPAKRFFSRDANVNNANKQIFIYDL